MPVDPASAIISTIGSLILGFGSDQGGQDRQSFGQENIVPGSLDLEAMIRAAIQDVVNAPPAQISDNAARNAAPFVMNQPQQSFAGVNVGIDPNILGFGMGTTDTSQFFTPQEGGGAAGALAALLGSQGFGTGARNHGRKLPPTINSGDLGGASPGPIGEGNRPVLTTPRRMEGGPSDRGRQDPTSMQRGPTNNVGVLPGFRGGPNELRQIFDTIKGFYGLGGRRDGGE